MNCAKLSHVHPMLAVSRPAKMAPSAILHLRKTLDVSCVLKEYLMEKMTMPGTYDGDNYYFFHHEDRKLVSHLKTRSKSKTPMEQATSSLAETLLSSISLRINEPYWLLHRGNCEHFVVIEQIRCIPCRWEKARAVLSSVFSGQYILQIHEQVIQSCCNTHRSSYIFVEPVQNHPPCGQL